MAAIYPLMFMRRVRCFPSFSLFSALLIWLLKVPFYRPYPDIDNVKMAAGLADDDLLQFPPMPVHLKQ
jgi:hypothetical protein